MIDENRQKKVLNVDKILDGLHVFDEMRQEGKELLENYAERLQNELCQKSLNANLESVSSLKKDKFVYIIKLVSKLALGIQFIKLMPIYNHQRKNMIVNAIPNLAITISTKRIYSPRLLNDTTNYLLSLVRGLKNGVQQNNIADEIADAKSICFFDPVLFSQLWKDKNNYKQASPYLIDMGFLIFLAIISPIQSIAFINKLFKQAKMLSQYKTMSKLRLFASFMILRGYFFIFSYLKMGKAIFLTSNSFATEILRMYLLQFKDCKSIYEILHGIPTKEFEKYINRQLILNESFSSYIKHHFLFQVPDMPLYGIFQKQSNNLTINTYLNKYLVERDISSKKDMLKFIEEESKLLLSNHQVESCFIASMTGAMAHDPCYINSPIFQIEKVILLHIKRELEKIGKPFQILYTPHPGHPLKMFKENPFFSQHNICIWKDTIFSWFITDICIALHSSAIFEAAYFGAKSFMPMRPTDELYPESLLTILPNGVVQQDDNFLAKLSSFFYLNLKNEPLKVREKAKMRVNLLNMVA